MDACEAVGEVRPVSAIDLLASLPADTVPFIFTDPPYGIGYHSNHYKGKNPHSPLANDWNFSPAALFNEAARVLCDGGVMYLCCRWDVYPLWAPAIVRPLILKTAIVWLKNNHSAGDLTGSFGNKYELILFIVKGRHQLRGQRWTNVWEFPRVSHTVMLHPTQKPEGLVRRAIEASTDLSDLVVDPFVGSGTTAVAAASCGRPFLVGDIDPAMIHMTRRRLGWESDPVPTPSEPAAPASLDWQIEHSFGAPADEIAYVAEMLRGRPS